jgi:hypothetical protein
MSDLHKHHLQLVGIAKGWALKNLPGWSDDSHRDLLTLSGAKAVYGKVSASTLNTPQLNAVLDSYERRGWPRQKKVFGKGASSKAVPPRIAHLVRLWGKLGAAGKVDSATRPTLLAWCVRQVNREVRDLDSLDVAECQKLTEALKGWLGR